MLGPKWLGNLEVRLPALDGHAPRIEFRDGRPAFGFDPRRMLEVLREERYAGELRSPTTRFPFPYWRLPGWLRLLAARCLYLPQRLRRADQNPTWPIAAAADVLLDLLGEPRETAWGASGWGLCITHDVDTLRGLRRCTAIADAVERAGFRSCFYVVGEVAAREPGIVRELHARGHEIGSHDIRHDNRLCHLPDAEMEDRLKRARALVEPHSGVGFRSPSLIRSPRLIEAVGRHFGYDSSLCDSDLEFPRGCTSVFPYRLRGCLELPVTLPMDSSLTYFGYRPEGILDLWRRKCAYIRGVGGLAVSVTHAEPHLTGGEKLLAALRRFLDWVAQQSNCTVLLPSRLGRDLLPRAQP